MSGPQRDTFINALLSTNIRQSVNILWKLTVQYLLKENQFRVLRRCQGKFNCLVFEILFIKNLKPNFNIKDGLHTCQTFCLITIVLFLWYSFLSPIVILLCIDCNLQIFFWLDNDVYQRLKCCRLSAILKCI